MAAKRNSVAAKAYDETGGGQAFLEFVAGQGGASACHQKFGGYNWQQYINRARGEIDRDLAEATTEEQQRVQAELEAKRNLAHENDRLRKELDFLKDFYARLQESLAGACAQFPFTTPAYPLPKRIGTSHLEELVILDVSDTQCGQQVTTEETGGLEVFGGEIFRERVQAYKDKVYTIVNDVLRKSVPIHNCLVILGGDIVEGENIYEGQQARLDALLFQQYLLATFELGDGYPSG